MEIKNKINDIQFNIQEKNPFLSMEFLNCLVESDVVHEKGGQTPLYFEDDNHFLAGYLKNHSYGEYIFDWSWADAYQKMRIAYYPKLIHYTPFTPVNVRKVLGEDIGLLDFLFELKNYYLENENISGHHYLFTTKRENEFLEDLNYHIRYSLQYHLEWDHSTFDDFLKTLKSRKRKMIIKERQIVESYELEISRSLLVNVTTEDIISYFNLYTQTINKKHAIAYLNLETFKLFQKYLGEKIIVVSAKLNDEIIAMSLFFKSADTLYGRYWGVDEKFSYDFPYLHFELCYYQGMELCSEYRLGRFEAGAQGEQKLLRGFKPVIITSAHHLRISQFHRGIGGYIREENKMILEQKKV